MSEALHHPAATLSSDADSLVSLPLPPTSGPYIEPPLSAPAPARVAAPAPVAVPPAPEPVNAPADEAPLRMPEPAVDDVEALRAKIGEQAHVIALAKTRVETLLEEKRVAYEREQALQQRVLALEAELAQTMAPAASTDVPTLAGLAARVAALEAAVADR